MLLNIRNMLAAFLVLTFFPGSSFADVGRSKPSVGAEAEAELADLKEQISAGLAAYDASVQAYAKEMNNRSGGPIPDRRSEKIAEKLRSLREKAIELQLRIHREKAGTEPGTCSATGASTVFTLGEQTVVRTGEVIHVLSAKSASCRSYSGIAEFEKSASISAKDRPLIEGAAKCFNPPTCAEDPSRPDCQRIVRQIEGQLRPGRPAPPAADDGGNTAR